MTKAELVSAIAEKTEFTKKDSEAALTAVLESITEALKKGINPQTKKKIKIPATKVPAFKAGKALKEAVAKVK